MSSRPVSTWRFSDASKISYTSTCACTMPKLASIRVAIVADARVDTTIRRCPRMVVIVNDSDSSAHLLPWFAKWPRANPLAIRCGLRFLTRAVRKIAGTIFYAMAHLLIGTCNGAHRRRPALLVLLLQQRLVLPLPFHLQRLKLQAPPKDQFRLQQWWQCNDIAYPGFGCICSDYSDSDLVLKPT